MTCQRGYISTITLLLVIGTAIAQSDFESNRQNNDTLINVNNTRNGYFKPLQIVRLVNQQASSSSSQQQKDDSSKNVAAKDNSKETVEELPVPQSFRSTYGLPAYNGPDDGESRNSGVDYTTNSAGFIVDSSTNSGVTSDSRSRVYDTATSSSNGYRSTIYESPDRHGSLRPLHSYSQHHYPGNSPRQSVSSASRGRSDFTSSASTNDATYIRAAASESNPQVDTSSSINNGNTAMSSSISSSTSGFAPIRRKPFDDSSSSSIASSTHHHHINQHMNTHIQQHPHYTQSPSDNSPGVMSKHYLSTDVVRDHSMVPMNLDVAASSDNSHSSSNGHSTSSNDNELAQLAATMSEFSSPTSSPEYNMPLGSSPQEMSLSDAAASFGGSFGSSQGLLGAASAFSSSIPSPSSVPGVPAGAIVGAPGSSPPPGMKLAGYVTMAGPTSQMNGMGGGSPMMRNPMMSPSMSQPMRFPMMPPNGPQMNPMGMGSMNGMGSMGSMGPMSLPPGLMPPGMSGFMPPFGRGMMPMGPMGPMGLNGMNGFNGMPGNQMNGNGNSGTNSPSNSGSSSPVASSSSSSSGTSSTSSAGSQASASQPTPARSRLLSRLNPLNLFRRLRSRTQSSTGTTGGSLTGSKESETTKSPMESMLASESNPVPVRKGFSFLRRSDTQPIVNIGGSNNNVKMSSYTASSSLKSSPLSSSLQSTANGRVATNNNMLNNQTSLSLTSQQQPMMTMAENINFPNFISPNGALNGLTNGNYFNSLINKAGMMTISSNVQTPVSGSLMHPLFQFDPPVAGFRFPVSSGITSRRGRRFQSSPSSSSTIDSIGPRLVEVTSTFTNDVPNTPSHGSSLTTSLRSLMGSGNFEVIRGGHFDHITSNSPPLFPSPNSPPSSSSSSSASSSPHQIVSNSNNNNKVINHFTQNGNQFDTLDSDDILNSSQPTSPILYGFQGFNHFANSPLIYNTLSTKDINTVSNSTVNQY